MPQTPPDEIRFNRDLDSGLSRPYIGNLISQSEPERFSSGLAAADYDGDGDVDLYVVGGNVGPNALYQNQGDGTFVDVAAALGVDLIHWGSGPTFGDIDGDGDLDLFIGSSEQTVYLFENRIDTDGVFVDITDASGLQMRATNTVSATFYDYDMDGFLDLFLAHWGAEREPGEDTETLWRNNGDRTFSNTSVESGIADGLVIQLRDWSFTPNIADIDGDGDGDLLMSADLSTSQVFVNNGDGTFTRTTDRRVITDQAGMGAAVADFDNDGDMDWFVTSIYSLDVVGGEHIGNRYYRNDGNGVFQDLTDPAGVANGDWGWGACAMDFDNDGNVDLFHVNGWVHELGKDFTIDQVRFFHAEGGGFFQEKATEVQLTNKGQGRGVTCFDADGDGDIDIVITNNSQDHVVYYRNESSNDNHYLNIRLQGNGGNRLGIGAHIAAVVPTGRIQVRQMGGSNNYVSHNPYEVHFGLGAATEADITVTWPDGSVSEMNSVAADQQVTIVQPGAGLLLAVAQGNGDGVYGAGDEIAIVAAVPPAHYHFSHWSSNRGGQFSDTNAAETTFVMPGNNVTVTAHYVPGVAPDDDVSVARRWNEVLMQAIRNDFARPTIHARNLFHVSSAMYDAWSAYAKVESSWLLGNTRAGTTCEFTEPVIPADVEAARAEAISYATYRIIRHRFAASPGRIRITRDADALMGFLGFDIDETSTDYASGSAAALGNYIAQCYIDFGLTDGANEENSYANIAYQPVNERLQPELPGNPNITDLNRWQPLSLVEFIDQAGNPISSTPGFLGPEWGSVVPFALSEVDRTSYTRGNFDYWVYHDPGMPPTIDGPQADNYKWAFSLVSVWSSHLDPGDGVMVDISPASLGNIQSYPMDFADYPGFYKTIEGGDASVGYDVNPATGAAYDPQLVPRGDYARVLAEFWADGPDSETPPGHWFVLLNEVSDHPLLQRRFGGTGPELRKLEWDVKAYFTMGGAMHDAAVTAWGIKGWYDYIRPISSLRAMADLGQTTDENLPSYHENGIPLQAGYIELVDADDPLSGEEDEHVDKIKFRAWKGPDFIDNPDVDEAGVDWVLAENWWPYQRPSFVTPPFAGYISGHSTFSRAAAEVMTALTGDAFFPGGMSGFEIRANEFLVFEEGPSVDMTLQWATYRDAADQCSLSRIWGGIHPPVDDIPGRLIGIKIGTDAFNHAVTFFEGTAP
ncbi:MAG: FG-GAP-like repeat-containing protein [Pseudomonadota bacterium]